MMFDHVKKWPAKMNFIIKTILVLLCSIFMCSCSSLQSKTDKNLVGYTESGKASFYADKHQSRKTANGEFYTHELNTAAHKTLPFGAMVRVTNLENGKSVVVKINDRGPFAKGRVIDLSKSAFSAIGNTSAGVIDVRIAVIK